MARSTTASVEVRPPRERRFIPIGLARRKGEVSWGVEGVAEAEELEGVAEAEELEVRDGVEGEG